ncbi:MAG: hypothetical protein HQL08_15435 [Nitrospirae bacterium]|nr:hypothetical protein [Nitrospirota bacterium]
MKRIIYAFGLIALTVGLVFICLGNGKTKSVKESGILSVEDIQADPAAFKGIITLNGVVARMHPSDPKRFAVIETAEAKHCQSVGCAKFFLPVHYEGKLPQIWDEVNITGSLVKQDGYLLKASRVDILRHLTFDGGKQ